MAQSDCNNFPIFLDEQEALEDLVKDLGNHASTWGRKMYHDRCTHLLKSNEANLYTMSLSWDRLLNETEPITQSKNQGWVTVAKSQTHKVTKSPSHKVTNSPYIYRYDTDKNLVKDILPLTKGQRMDPNISSQTKPKQTLPTSPIH